MAAKSASTKRAATKPAAAKLPATNKSAKIVTAKSAPAKGSITKSSAAKKSAKAAPTVKKGPVALRTAAARKPAPSESPTYYIVVDREQLLISNDKPKTTGRVVTATNFDEAKERALDVLIELIDKFEHRLWQVKQSLDHESLVK